MMKRIIKREDAMELLVRNLSVLYPGYSNKRDGVMQFRFMDKFSELDCYIVFSGDSLTLEYGIGTSIDLELRCLFKDWIHLAGGQLSLTWGVITGKLKFKGDMTFFDVLPTRKVSANVSYFGEIISEFESNPSKHWDIPRKVMVIDSSPHDNVGYIDVIIRAFVEGINSVEGVQVEIARLSEVKINKCTGCWKCWMTKDSDCIFSEEDNFEAFYKKVNEMDLVVYAFPLYTDGMPVILKNYYERSTRKSYPAKEQLYHYRGTMANKQSMFVLGCCGFPNGKLFKDVKVDFRETAHNNHTPIVGELYRSGMVYLFSNPLIYNVQKDILDGLKKCGREVVMTGKLSRKNKIKVERKLRSGGKLTSLMSYFWHRNRDYRN